MDHPTRGKSERRNDQHAMFRQEQRWFQSAYLKPGEMRIDPRLDTENLVEFQDLIWNSPTRRMLPYYGSTPEELARLWGRA